MDPEDSPKPFDWRRLGGRDVDTCSGRMESRAAAVQILLLPVLILLWAIAVVVIILLV